MEWLKLILTGLSVALLEAIVVLIVWEKNRKAALSDRAMEKNDVTNQLFAKVESLAERVEKVYEKSDEIREMIPPLRTGVCESLGDRIISLCDGYLKRCSVTTEELDRLERLYSAYHALGGNGNVTNLLNRVRALPVA